MSVLVTRMKEVLKPKYFKDFSKFMGGQTGEIVDGKLAVYEEDVIRWLRKLPVVD